MSHSQACQMCAQISKVHLEQAYIRVYIYVLLIVKEIWQIVESLSLLHGQKLHDWDHLVWSLVWFVKVPFQIPPDWTKIKEVMNKSLMVM